MARLDWILLGLVACKHTAPVGIDANLPEETESIDRVDPRAVLDQEAAELNPSLRAIALDLVLRNDWGPEWDARALGDPSEWVQRRAVHALADRGTPDAQELLVAFIVEPSRDPMARATAALSIRNDASAAAIAAAWRTEPTAWRRVPLALAALVHGDQEALAPLATTIERGELPLEIDLFHAMGQSADRALVPSLKQAQEVVEPEMVLPIAAARWMLGDATAEEPFRKAVVGKDIERRLEALDYLVRLDRDQVRGLLSKARATGPSLVTWYADLALAAADGTDPGLFERASNDPDREVRELAVRFATEVAASTEPNRRLARVAQDVLVQRLADEHATVRVAALRAVRQLRLVDAAATVDGMTGDDNRTVRLEASGTLLLLEDS